RELELEKPTPLQQRAIPPLLQGLDVLAFGIAGGGKTTAGALATLHLLTDRPLRAEPKEPRALWLAPGPDEAEQARLLLEACGRFARLRHVVAADGSSRNQQAAELRTGVEILVATPRRLLELLRQRAVDLRAVELVVL